jgi:RHS repeat-associated protein
MSGKPAARMGDLTKKGGPIVQGSATVLIGSQGGIACSLCPGGVTVGSPVNPILGAKILSDEVDAALPGPMGLVWSRNYSSYVSKDNIGANGINAAQVGLLGPGWHVPTALSIVLSPSEEDGVTGSDLPPTRLFDGKGRVISFSDALDEGTLLGSTSESLSVYRTTDRIKNSPDANSPDRAAVSNSTVPPKPKRSTKAALSAAAAANAATAAATSAPTLDAIIAQGHDNSDAAQIHRHLGWVAQVNARWANDSSIIVAWSWGGTVVWVFERQPIRSSNPHQGTRYQLIAMVDAFGRALQWHYDRVGILAGFTDGVGRRYRLELIDVLNNFAPHDANAPDEQAQALIDRIYSDNTQSSAQTTWGRDSGLRLAALHLTHDPHASNHAPRELVRYRYGNSVVNYGDLIEVIDPSAQGISDRSAVSSAVSGTVLRSFSTYQGMMLAHRYVGGSETHYEYETTPPQPGSGLAANGQTINPRVVLQKNVGGLDYRFHYEHPSTQHTTVTDSLGRIEIYRFKGAAGLCRLVEYSTAVGTATQATTRFEHDAYGRLIATIDPLGRTTRYRLDANGALMGVQSAAGMTRSDRDAKSGKLTEYTGIDGLATKYRYDAHERLIEVTASDGSSTQFAYPTLLHDQGDADNTNTNTNAPVHAKINADNAIRITDASGKHKHLQWSALGQLIAYTDCSNQTTHYRYHHDGQISEVIDAEGYRTRYDYDNQNRRIATYAPDGSIERYRYDAANRLIELTDATNSKTVYLYDSRGRISGVQRNGLGLAYEWDAADRLTTLINENQARSSFQYDVFDRLIEEVGFDGRTQQYAYDLVGRLSASRENTPSGVQGADPRDASTISNVAALPTTHYRYDEADRLIERKIPATAHAAIAIDAFKYDQAGRLTELTRARHSHSPLTGQKNSAPQNSVQQNDSVPESTLQFAYDSMGRLIRETQQLGKSFTHTLTHRYDILGNRIGTELPDIGLLELHTYGSGHVHSVSLAGESIVDFERDKLHREYSRTFAGLTLTRELDPLGRMRAQRVTQSASAAQLAKPSDTAAPVAGQQQALDALAYLDATYGYDSSGQLIETLRGASLISKNNVTEISAGSKTRTQYAYDSAQRLVGWQAGEGSAQRKKQWRFDPAGNRLPAAIPKQAEGSTEMAWSERVRDNLANPRFNLIAPDYQAQFGKRPKVERWKTNQIEFDGPYAYSHDAYGNLIHKQHIDGTSTRYGYDGEHRLVWLERTELVGHESGADSGDGRGIRAQTSTTRYCYDAIGRRLEKSTQRAAQLAPTADQPDSNNERAAETTHYGWDGDRLVSTHGAVESIHTVYEAGSFVPLLRITQPATTHTREQDPVNSIGVLDSLSANHESELDKTELLPDPILDSIARQAMQSAFNEVAKNGLPQLAKQTMRAMGIDPDAVEAKISITVKEQSDNYKKQLTVQRYYCNHLGTPVALVSGNGMLDWAIDVDAWGNTLVEYNPNNIDQSIRMQGQQIDRESGLFYNRYRYYEPEQGRYVTQDPIGRQGGSHHYAYVLNSPTVGYDPTGLIIPLIVLGAIAGKALLGAALGGGIEIGMQGGKQVLGQVKDNWDNGKPLTDVKWKCVDIDWGQVGVSAAIGTVAPGMFGAGKTILSSGGALKTLSGQAANTANRAAKIAARKKAHTDTIKSTVATQAAWQTTKGLTKCLVAEEDKECTE